VTIFGVVINTAYVLMIITSFAIPAVSALLTSQKLLSKGVTGLLSLLLSYVSAFFAQWSQSADLNHYNWTKFALLGLGSFLVAVLSQNGIVARTNIETNLLNFRLTRRAPAPTPTQQAA
jgi:hypothetical protein